jgi:hypothetical protein
MKKPVRVFKLPNVTAVLFFATLLASCTVVYLDSPQLVILNTNIKSRQAFRDLREILFDIFNNSLIFKL